MFIGFDRHEILKAHYAKQIEAWDWKGIAAGCELHPGETRHDDPELKNWLGTVFGIMPSGKVYMPWTSNQTDHDMQRDQAFREALEEAAEAHHGYITDYDDGILFAMAPRFACDTWFERDRSAVKVTETRSGTVLLDLYDEEVEEAIVDGFLISGRKLEESAIEYALELFANNQ